MEKTRLRSAAVLYKVWSIRGDSEVGFGHSEFDVAQDVRKNREATRHLPQ